jgi:hypothetical protein
MKKKLHCLKDKLLHGLATLAFLLLLTPGFAQYPVGSPVAINGKLKVVGTNLTNECGVPVQLRGMSSHGLQWYGGCVNSSSLDALTNTWGIDIFRLAMYVDEGGYLTNPSGWKSQIDGYVDLCAARGIYCIIDWHILTPGDPNAHTTESLDFWSYMATKHGSKKHVLYEICNEPNGVSWGTVKNYATQVVGKIRAIDPSTIIIIGTPSYSQDVDVASFDKVVGTNLMYTLHFYSASHFQSFRDKANTAISNGAAIFVTEWGTSQASGTGTINLTEADNWMSWMITNKISWCNWSFSDNSGTSSALNGGSCGSSGWNSLTQSGTYVKGKLTGTPHSFPPCGSAAQKIEVFQSTTDVPNKSSFNFANVISSGSKAVTFTIMNQGSQALTLTGTPKVAVSGTNAAQFVVTTQPAASSLSINQSTTFVVTFTPGTTGAMTATLSIANNDANNNPYTIVLNGAGTLTATAPKIGISQNGTAIPNAGTYSIGTTTAGSKNTQTFTISNTGDNVLNISGITASTGFAVLLPIPTTVAIGGTAVFSVQYASTTTTPAGPVTGSFTVANDDVTNASYKVNLTTTVVTCPVSDNIQDWDANYTNSTNVDTWNTRWVDLKANPLVNTVNPSGYVAQYSRAAATPTYDGVKFKMCGTNTINLTAAKSMVSMLVYSPAAGTPILMNLKTAADVANTTTYPSTSSATVNTTKAGQWERLYFDHSAAVGLTGIIYVELFADPLAAKGAGVYYFDDIKLDMMPCNISSTGILLDYDNQRNMSFAFNPADAYTDPFVNPAPSSVNNTPNAMQWIRTAPSVPASATTDNYHLIRYKVCGGTLNLNTTYGSMISMSILSPKAGIPITISLKDATSGTTITEIAAQTVKTSKAGVWETLVFDFTAVKTSTLIKAVDIFIDPLSVNTATVASRTYLIDEIKLTNTLPCVAAVGATRIFNDFDANRNIDLAFAPTGTWNDVTPNPVTTGINTSATVAAYGRPATTTADVLRFAGCNGTVDLARSKTLISFMINSPVANVPVTLSLKNALGKAVLDVNLITSSVVNAWQELDFDCSAIIGNTTVTSIDILIDPAGTNGAKTYYIDNLQYSDLQRMSVFYTTSLITNATPTPFDMGTVNTGASSSTLTFTIQNTGLNDLILSGTPMIAVTGTNASEFVIDQTKTTSPITSGLTTTFTITFKPTAVGTRTALVSIASNDGAANPYTFPVRGIACLAPSSAYTYTTAPTGAVSFNATYGTTANNPTTYAWAFGDAANGTSAIQSPTYTYKASAVYSACLTVTSAVCGAAPKVCQSINVVITGLKDMVNATGDLKIYPTLTNSIITVETPGLATVRIFNILGESLLTNEMVDKANVDVSSLPSGMYIISVQKGLEVTKKQFIKQ